ncbi:MAG: hypothetical protein GY750_14500, partial [Lentisphaerae bacterium]|nr:hypothetical protein [Lentisphaerota bacterium]
GMTTTEFCKAFPNDTKLPTWKGDVKTAANEFIVLDAIKYRLIGDMAKELIKDV